jgi:hypothetical protein
MGYLKVLLTIIAVCQVYYVAKDAITPAHAQGVVDVNVARVNGIAFGVMPVRVQP